MMLKYVKLSDVLICPNGLQAQPYLKNNVQNTNKKPEILFLSNLIESKGVFVLLDALFIKKDGFNFHCNYVGGVRYFRKPAFKKNSRTWS